jgi:VWFA-related protein
MFVRPLAIALLLVSAASTRAQQPDPAQAPTLKLSTRIVVLDVVVVDSKKRIVTTGLTRDDFQIVEDRTSQTVRSFEVPGAHAMPPGVVVSSAADLNRIERAPVTVLVLDELNTRFEAMAFARQAMVNYLASQPALLPQPTSLLLASNTRFLQLHDYTQNRDQLIDLVKHHLPEYPSKMMAGRGGPAAVERMAQSLASLEQIAQSSMGTAGRKNVIWVGAGFPSADLVGLDPKTAATIETAVHNCTGILLAARVTLYTIDPTANSTETVDVETPDDLTMAQTDNGGELYVGSIEFSALAPATGGRAFRSRNDVGVEIGEAIDRGNNFYTLSYSPSNHSDNAQKYRHIAIFMRDKSLHATTRNGYFPESLDRPNVSLSEPPRQAKAQFQMEISSAVNSSISYNGLTVKAIRVGENYVIRVQSKGLTWASLDSRPESARVKTEVSVIAAWYTDKNKLMGHIGKELTASRVAVADASQPIPDTTFLVPVPQTGNAARLRFVVRDAVNGSIGTVDLKP